MTIEENEGEGGWACVVAPDGAGVWGLIAIALLGGFCGWQNNVMSLKSKDSLVFVGQRF